ncbi:hypothetical protein DVH05_008870 [Phytophthora capsici]|nr:hypothetical protein DVH05_008870 [Phytophthora capsici]
MLDKFFDGYNATVFAYGQTGSGKTYTMGNEFNANVASTELGIIPRVIEKIFKRVTSSPNPQHFLIKVSYLEILNEEIHDLLAQPTPESLQVSTGLSIRGDGDRGIVVVGLSEHTVDSTEQAGELLRAGALARATASTGMNAQSSRSHAICTIAMEHHDVRTVEGGTETRFSKFHLVDLAGSERVRRTNSEGARFKEGVNINRGLLALGNVINALCERRRTSSSTSHTPYRDSKLTRLLQDSLGGNSKTLMIACVSPADVNYEETSNTLRYASRARNIENQAVINKERSAENEVLYLKQQVKILQLQLLQQTQDKESGRIKAGGHRPINVEQDNRRHKELRGATDTRGKKASELVDNNKDVNGETKALTDNLPSISTPKANENGKGDMALSRLEQLRIFQSQKLKSINTKANPAVNRRTDGTTVPSKRSRTLMPPTTPDIRRTSSSVRTPDTKGTIESNAFSIATTTKLLQQVMASREAISSAKEAVQTNVADRKALAIAISRFKALPSIESAETLAKLQDELRKKTDSIRILQQQLASIEETMSLPSGLFPTRIEICHDLIRHLIQALVESKEECTNCQVELKASNEQIEKLTKELQKQTTKRKAAKKRKQRQSYETMETLFSSSDEEEDNSADSDYVDEEDRRARRTKRKRGASIPSNGGDPMDEINELLETSAATCCSCHGKCATKACVCKSQSRICSKECSCNSQKCQNQGNAAPPADGDSTSESQKNGETTDEMVGRNDTKAFDAAA